MVLDEANASVDNIMGHIVGRHNDPVCALDLWLFDKIASSVRIMRSRTRIQDDLWYFYSEASLNNGSSWFYYGGSLCKGIFIKFANSVVRCILYENDKNRINYKINR